MAYKCREEIVGKRFLSVSGFTKLKLGKINEWGWRAGVIRAASHKDNKHPDLQVLVEYDGVEWQRREWISVFKDGLFHLFLIEGNLVWAERGPADQSSHTTASSTQGESHCFWPALSFLALLDKSEMTANNSRLPIEFLVDHELTFRDPARLRPFKEWDPKLLGSQTSTKGSTAASRKPLRRASPDDVRAAVRRWAEFQDGQRILLTTPSVLVGYRVEVYRAEGTTQWYTAVIVGYNESTRELTVTDDTVLEEHNEDPRLVQMRLIGDGVVESIMRGENAGITSRRSRSSAAAASSALGGGGSGGSHSSLAPTRVTRCYALSAAYSSGGNASTGAAGGGTGGSSSGGAGANRNCTSSVTRKPRSSRLAASDPPQQQQQQQPEASAPVADPATASPPVTTASTSDSPRSSTTDTTTTSATATTTTEAEKDENVLVTTVAAPPDYHHNSKRVVTRDKARLDRRRKGSGGPSICTTPVVAHPERLLRGGRRGAKPACVHPEEEEEEEVRKKGKSEVSCTSLRRGAKAEKEEAPKAPAAPPQEQEEVIVVDPPSELVNKQEEEKEEGGVGGEERPPQEDAGGGAKEESEVVAEGDKGDKPSIEGSDDKVKEVCEEVRVKEEEDNSAIEGGGECSRVVPKEEEVVKEEEKEREEERAVKKEVPLEEKEASTGGVERRGGEAEDEAPSSPVPRMEGEPFIPNPSHRYPLTHPGHQEHHQQTPTSAAHALLQHHHASQPPSALRLSASSDSLHAPPPSSSQSAHPRGCCCCVSSDSGVSSASSSSSSSRCYSSGSGDERCSSGSRASSALSAEERSASAHEELSGAQASTASRTTTPPYPPSPAGAPSPSSRYLPFPGDGKTTPGTHPSVSAAESVRVWRDPTLASAQRVRHVQSVQHQTLMSHPPSSSPSAASSSSSVVFSAGGAVGAAPSAPGAAPLPASATSAPAPAASIAVTHAAAAAAALSLGHHSAGAPPHHPHAHHYPPPLLGAHHHALHHGAALALAAAAAPPLYSQLPEMLWKPRYAPLPPGPPAHLLPPGHPAEDLLERERAYAQDRHERLLRERREQEARELEKQHKERERAERAERERVERERAAERERRERAEQQERERMEKQRAAEQAVHKHFEESLRLAHQKQRNNMCWNLINSLPPPRTTASLVAEEAERKRAEHEQQRLVAVRERERTYYAAAGTSAQQRPSSGPGKLEYPPPPAHSRMVDKSSEKSISGHGGHSPLPKVEPNFNLFGYPAYQPPGFLSPEKMKVESKSPVSTTASQLTVPSQPLSSSPGHGHHHSHSMGLGLPRELPNPPPLTSDLSKNSVIVKNEGKQQSSKVPQSHHQSPAHLHAKSVGLQSSAYEYHQRSPTRSPIGLHHSSHHSVHHQHHHSSSHHQHQSSPHHPGQIPHLASEPQNLAKGPQPMSHGQPSHAPQERVSPYGTPTSNHLTFTPIGPPKANSVTSPYQAYGPSPLHQGSQQPPASHYTPSGSSSTSSLGNKPKVSSPAPPHIYGRPTAGVSSGGSTAGRTVPIDVPQSGYPLPLTAKTLPYPVGVPHSHASSGAGPPPAHSGSDPRPYDPRAYPPTPITRPSTVPAVAVSHSAPSSRRIVNQSPSNIPPIPSPVHRNEPPPLLHGAGGIQTQPLDLGLSDRSREEDSTSPKRKGVTDRGNTLDTCASKKRRSDLISLSPVASTMPQAVLARVSEPGPLVASAAASITTVVNTSLGAIPPDNSVTVPSISVVSCRKNAGSVARPSSAPEDCSVSAVPRPPVSSSPVARQTPSSGNGAASTPVPPSSPVSQSTRPPSVGGTESEKSNSPGPSRPLATQSTAPSYPVHKLKKAWLQRHSGEDGTEGTIVNRNGGGAFPCSPPSSQPGTASPSTGQTSVSDASSRRGQPSSPPRPRQQSKGRAGSEGQASGNKVTGGRRGARDAVVTPNGHTVAMDTTEILEDSSSSDPESKSPTKRKVWKSKKRKKGATRAKVMEETTPTKRRAGGEGESQSESEKESGSDKESDSGGSTMGQGRGGRGGSGGGGGSGTGSGGTAGRGNEGKEPRRRGRRPKARGEDRARQSGGSGGGGGGGGSSSTQSQCATTANDCNSNRTVPAGHLSNSSDSSRSATSNARGGLRKGRSGGVDGGSGDPPRRDPCRKPPVSQLKKTGESFLQDGSCFEVAPKLAKCRECRWTPNQRSRNMPNIFCRFFAFRRLRYTKNGQLAMAGFSDPHGDASEEDLKLWLPQPENPPSDLDVEMSRFLLSQVGDQFCDLVEQEKDAISLHMSEDKTIAWKRVVQGVREMCDVCETTLFNYHWACGKCGFVVCIDCYKGRKNGTIKIWEEASKDRDDFSWLLCTNRQAHEQEKLMLTQIIADDSLLNLGAHVHFERQKWGISQFCRCISNKEQKGTNGIAKDLLKNLIKCETLNGVVKTEKTEGEGSSEGTRNNNSNKNGSNGGAGDIVARGGGGGDDEESKNSPLNWLADVALSNEDKKQSEGSVSSSDSEDDKENYSTLRELLIRPSNVGGGSSGPTSPAQPSSSPSITGTNKARSRSLTPTGGVPPSKKSRTSAIDTMDTLDQVISSAIRDVAGERASERSTKGNGEGEEGTEEAAAPMQLKHFIRRFSLQSREPLPIRIMTLAESMALYPDVPHSWLCDGKLLRLHDPNNRSNYRIFQDQWKRGQPVLVSDVTKSLDLSLWHPDSFARDFGDDKNDLINCSTGNIVPNQPMRRFWEGFEVVSRRLRDDKGQPMLLKLKDWPPGEDFAETLPARFADLMKALPLTEYTHRNGRLNIASRLPECFVRPDLGPKMYNAYGSALHPTKGTTNLHLDVSDAVNVMVYVGIPQDTGDNDEHTREALRAIEEAGCDILTRRRVKEKGIIPGALWHIYAARDADRIRDLLNKVAIEQGARLEPHHDPIHDQSWYLDGALRERLYSEYGVEGFALVQCLGDAVFIPAGAPHQVRNLHSCIKVAEDFVSPENVSHCFHLTQEFRELSDTHTNHEDKLQIKNIIYHAVKDSLSVLMGQSKVDDDKKISESGEEGSLENASNSASQQVQGEGESSSCLTTIKEEPTET